MRTAVSSTPIENRARNPLPTAPSRRAGAAAPAVTSRDADGTAGNDDAMTAASTQPNPATIQSA
jgi:hypothetical protein